jgi:hypothetical protein
MQLTVHRFISTVKGFSTIIALLDWGRVLPWLDKYLTVERDFIQRGIQSR